MYGNSTLLTAEEVLEGCRGCRVAKGGQRAHVVWSRGMTTGRNKMTSTRVVGFDNCVDSPQCSYLLLSGRAHAAECKSYVVGSNPTL